MPKKITVTIPEEVAAELKKLAHKEARSEEEVLLDAIKRRTFGIRLQKRRVKMTPRARKMGIFTDQDVFDIVS